MKEINFYIEDVVFEGKGSVPRKDFIYFSLCKKGKTYKVLYAEREGEKYHVMSNGEYELKTNKPFFDACANLKKGSKILMLGWGMGVVMPHIEKYQHEIHVVEKYQQVIDLTPVPKDVVLHMGDACALTEIETLDKDYDLIFVDILSIDPSELGIDVVMLQEHLKDSGEILFWRHERS